MARGAGRQHRAHVRDGQLSGGGAGPGGPSTDAIVVRAAAVLGLVWFGDALIYVVLPLHAEAFGIGLGMVGVALSLNRIVRIVGYGWVAVLHRRLGLRALTASAALGAALSTVGYGLALGLLPLLVARLMWGFAYGVLNVTTTAYAIGDGQGTGRRVGLNRAVGTVGPALALSGGAWLAGVVGPRDVFLILGVLGLLAVPLALTLPREVAAASERGRPAATRWRPSALNVLFFTISAVDGAFAMTLSLLFAGSLGVGSALLAAGLLLALQRVAVVVLSLVAGRMIDRLGADRLLAPCVVIVIVGLIGLAQGIIYPAAIVIIVARAFLSNVGPGAGHAGALGQYRGAAGCLRDVGRFGARGRPAGRRLRRRAPGAAAAVRRAGRGHRGCAGRLPPVHAARVWSPWH